MALRPWMRSDIDRLRKYNSYGLSVERVASELGRSECAIYDISRKLTPKLQWRREKGIRRTISQNIIGYVVFLERNHRNPTVQSQLQTMMEMEKLQ